MVSSRVPLGGLATQAGCPTSRTQPEQASPVSGSMRITLPPSMQATQSFPSASVHIPSGIRSSSSKRYSSLGQAAGEAQDSSPGVSHYEQGTPEFKYQQLSLSHVKIKNCTYFEGQQSPPFSLGLGTTWATAQGLHQAGRQWHRIVGISYFEENMFCFRNPFS